MAAETGFSRSERLRERRDFIRLSASAVRFPSKHFISLASPDLRDGCRLGITASRKVGNAVTRNRIKRLIRECYRNNKESFPMTDISIIVRKGAANLTYIELCQELVNAINRIGQQLRS